MLLILRWGKLLWHSAILSDPLGRRERGEDGGADHDPRIDANSKATVRRPATPKEGPPTGNCSRSHGSKVSAFGLLFLFVRQLNDFSLDRWSMTSSEDMVPGPGGSTDGIAEPKRNSRRRATSRYGSATLQNPAGRYEGRPATG